MFGINVASRWRHVRKMRHGLAGTTGGKSPQALFGTDASMEQQEQNKPRRKRQRPKRNVVFRTPTTSSTLLWRYGESILDVAKSVPGQQLLGDVDNMEGPCGGQMSCSTCHVYLDKTTYEALPPPVEEELDMIDLAFEPKETSRLGCQVKLDGVLAELEHEVVVTLPSGVNNEWE